MAAMELFSPIGAAWYAGVGNLSSQTRDGTRVSWGGSTESYLWDLQGSPGNLKLRMWLAP